MSDDETFIRAIVDAPGDDLPRLVYADWLDDRDDPRGVYLRAECEAVETGDVARLRELAVGIDPVWVARVSRPPIGVCCDRVRFKNCGPVLEGPQIDETERRFGGEFSPDFRAFLLNYNGGEPSPARMPYPDEAGPLWIDMDLEIGRFYKVSPAEEKLSAAEAMSDSEIDGERAFLEELFQMGGGTGANPLIADMVPFANTLHDLGALLIGVGDANRGRVFHFRDYCHWSDDPNHLFDYADNFAVFLARLRPARDS